MSVEKPSEASKNIPAAQVPRVVFSDQERRSGLAAREKIAAAAQAVRETGVVYLENVFDVGFISRLHEEYVARYSRYFKEDLYDDVLPVGNRRMMITVEISGIFNQPLIYANPLLYPVMQELLGPKFIMGGFGSVTSLPGAQAQHIHRDHPPLFGDFDYVHKSPSFALTMAIPMIDMNLTTGTTRMYPGTHRMPQSQTLDKPYVDPVAAAGSVLIWDYLIYHGGTANQSDKVRPLLYFSYCRPWFHDAENYSIQDPIQISAEEFAKVPDVLKPLFWWSVPRAKHDWSKTTPGHQPCPCMSGKLFRDCHGTSVS